MPTTESTGAGNGLRPTDLTDSLRRLEGLPLDALRREWQRQHHRPPPRSFGRDLLLRSLAYRLQEIAFGGLPPATQRRIPKLGAKMQAAGRQRSHIPASQLKPGVTLLREWHGRTHTVLVREDGFEYQDQRYASLTQIARQITGAHWSGPRFFGLQRVTNQTKSLRADPVRASNA